VTPLGLRIRELRLRKGVMLKDMAEAFDVSSAYLSALEHGKRGRPSRMFVQRICEYFNIIWDDADDLERLASLSHPRVTVDTAGLGADATELANRLAQTIRKLPQAKIARLLAEIKDT
jgi:transcriptional regulator with XRE-family HTH domain